MWRDWNETDKSRHHNIASHFIQNKCKFVILLPVRRLCLGDGFLVVLVPVFQFLFSLFSEFFFTTLFFEVFFFQTRFLFLAPFTDFLGLLANNGGSYITRTNKNILHFKNVFRWFGWIRSNSTWIYASSIICRQINAILKRIENIIIK